MTALSNMKQGMKAKIIDINQHNRLLVQHLMNFNIGQGSVCIIKEVLCFGGPISIEVNGMSLFLRKRDAHQILVEVI
jgi:ferrous iron transport protein A